MNPKHISLMIALALGAASLDAAASGYRFGSQSVSAQGTAESNGAEAADASTIFANPAGLSRLEGRQFMGGVTALVPHSTFQDSVSTRFTRGPTGGAAKGTPFQLAMPRSTEPATLPYSVTATGPVAAVAELTADNRTSAGTREYGVLGRDMEGVSFIGIIGTAFIRC